jgi:hypothetical protein
MCIINLECTYNDNDINSGIDQQLDLLFGSFSSVHSGSNSQLAFGIVGAKSLRNLANTGKFLKIAKLSNIYFIFVNSDIITCLSGKSRAFFKSVRAI